MDATAKQKWGGERRGKQDTSQEGVPKRMLAHPPKYALRVLTHACTNAYTEVCRAHARIIPHTVKVTTFGLGASVNLPT